MTRFRFAPLASVVLVAFMARQSMADAPAGHFQIGSGPLAGTVHDTFTKLTWQQAVVASGYPWGSSNTVGTAQHYCASLALAGGGWRLPTLPELSTLIDYSQGGGPYIDSSAFPSTPAVPFWTSSPLAATNSMTAWIVGFDYGYTGNNVVTNKFNVRCVR